MDQKKRVASIQSLALRFLTRPKVVRLVLLGALTPAVVAAQSSPINSIGDFAKVLCDIGFVIYALSLVIGVVMAVVAAYKYMFSQGDPNKVSEAHKTLTYAAVGLAVAFVSWGLPNIVMTLLGGDEVTGCESQT
ncbi:MAG: Type secretion system pilin [Candidatus Parcubacteria bacterium]|jgi:hypothetical protein